MCALSITFKNLACAVSIDNLWTWTWTFWGNFVFFWLLSSSFYVKGPFLNLRRANAIIASKNVTTDQCYVKELYSFILQLINTLLGLTRPNISLWILYSVIFRSGLGSTSRPNLDSPPPLLPEASRSPTPSSDLVGSLQCKLSALLSLCLEIRVCRAEVSVVTLQSGTAQYWFAEHGSSKISFFVGRSVQ